MKTKIFLFCSVLAGSFFVFSPASALTIHTPSIEITLKPGDTLVQHIGLSDSSLQGVTVFPGVGSYVDDATSASGMRLIQEPSATQSWIFPDGDHIDLPADGSVVQLGLTIQVPADALSGAYALALRFPTALTAAPDVRTFQAQDVLQIFLTVADGTRDDVMPTLQLASSGRSSRWFSRTALWQADASFVASFKNTGNTFLRPYGVLDVRNRLFGSMPTRTVVNAAKQRLLPGASRAYTLPDITGGAGFGRYTVTFTTHYGSPEKTLTVTNTFWLLPPPFVTTVASLFLFVCLFFLVWMVVVRHRSNLVRHRESREKELRRVFLNPKTTITKRSMLRTKKNSAQSTQAKPVRRLDGPQRSIMIRPKSSAVSSLAQSASPKSVPAPKKSAARVKPIPVKLAVSQKKPAPRVKPVPVPPNNLPVVEAATPVKQLPVTKKRETRKRGRTSRTAA